jgi:hypothetical protein
MANPVLGEDFTVSVATAAAPTVFSPVADINSYRRGSSRDETRRIVFGRTLPYIIPGRRDQTMEFGGFLNLTDPGQVILRNAEMNNTEVVVKVLFNGVDGFTQQGKVSSFSHEASPEDLQPHSFVIAPTAAAAVVAGGPIL